MKDYFEYAGKICVVTGAASGMGKATAEMLVDLGAVVYAIDYQPIHVDGIKASIVADISKKEEIDAAFAEVPETIDSFFGIAGVSGQKHSFVDMNVINFLANKYMVETYLDSRMNDGGTIAFVTSLAGLHWEKHIEETCKYVEVKGWDETKALIEEAGKNEKVVQMGYFFSKRLMSHYAAAIVEHFSKRSIRVNYTMPAGAKTGLTDDFAKMMGGEENLVTGMTKRLSTSEENASALVFLNSPMGGYINGVGLIIDYANTVPEMLKQRKQEYNFPLFS